MSEIDAVAYHSSSGQIAVMQDCVSRLGRSALSWQAGLSRSCPYSLQSKGGNGLALFNRSDRIIENFPLYWREL
jgi:hypothetical protein